MTKLLTTLLISTATLSAMEDGNNNPWFRHSKTLMFTNQLAFVPSREFVPETPAMPRIERHQQSFFPEPMEMVHHTNTQPTKYRKVNPITTSHSGAFHAPSKILKERNNLLLEKNNLLKQQDELLVENEDLNVRTIEMMNYINTLEDMLKDNVTGLRDAILTIREIALEKTPHNFWLQDLAKSRKEFLELEALPSDPTTPYTPH